MLFVIFVISAVIIVAGWQILSSLFDFKLPLVVQWVIVGLFFLFLYSVRDKAKKLIEKYLNK